MEFKRITIFAGHYGSGKSHLAVNAAKMLVGQGSRVLLADLDIVNPYYRSADAAPDLKEAGIELIVSPYANSNVDVPALPSEMYRVTEDRSCHAVLDVGGDDRGALALGRLTPAILQENDYDMLFVFNALRPLTRTAHDALEVMREIEMACGIPFTGIVNNTNLGRETDSAVILRSVPVAEELSLLSGLPVAMTTADEKLFPGILNDVPDCFPLRIQRAIQNMT